MKQFTKALNQLLVVAFLMLPWATTEALETFEQAGYISSISYDTFTLKKKTYRISPDARLVSNDSGKKKFSDFKAGDPIYFKGKILFGVYYVDIIYYETPVPS